MTDKVQKIRKEVERLRKSYQIMYQELDCESPELMSVCAKRNLCQDILMFIDSLQEEPVSIKDKLRALSDGKQHLGWLDDANALEEPVSEDLESEIDRFFKPYFNLDGIAIKGLEDDYPKVEDLKDIARHFANWQKEKDNQSVSEDLEKAVNAYIGYAPEVDESSSVYGKRQAFKAGAEWQFDRINEVLLSEVLPCFMHGGEADEVVAKLDEVLNQKK